MALRHLEGFNSYGSTSDIPQHYDTVVAGLNGLTTGRRAGTKAYYFAGGRIGKVLDSQSTWITGMAVNQSAFDDLTLVSWQTSSDLEQVSLRLDASGYLYVSRDGTTLWSGAGNAVYRVLTAWRYVEFAVTIHGSTGQFSLRMDGLDSTLVTQTGLNTAGQGGTTADRFLIGNGSAGGLSTPITDWYVCDNTGSTHNTMLGDCRVDPLWPSADGTYTDFSVVGVANRYDAINDHPHNSDTDYIHSSTVGNKNTVNLDNLAYTPSFVYGVRVSAVERKDDSGARGTKILIRTNSTDYLATNEKGLTTTYTLDTNTWAVNPNTGVLFTPTEINALEIGVEVTT